MSQRTGSQGGPRSKSDGYPSSRVTMLSRQQVRYRQDDRAPSGGAGSSAGSQRQWRPKYGGFAARNGPRSSNQRSPPRGSGGQPRSDKTRGKKAGNFQPQRRPSSQVAHDDHRSSERSRHSTPGQSQSGSGYKYKARRPEVHSRQGARDKGAGQGSKVDGSRGDEGEKRKVEAAHGSGEPPRHKPRERQSDTKKGERTKDRGASRSNEWHPDHGSNPEMTAAHKSARPSAGSTTRQSSSAVQADDNEAGKSGDFVETETVKAEEISNDEVEAPATDAPDMAAGAGPGSGPPRGGAPPKRNAGDYGKGAKTLDSVFGKGGCGKHDDKQGSMKEGGQETADEPKTHSEKIRSLQRQMKEKDIMTQMEALEWCDPEDQQVVAATVTAALNMWKNAHRKGDSSDQCAVALEILDHIIAVTGRVKTNELTSAMHPQIKFWEGIQGILTIARDKAVSYRKGGLENMNLKVLADKSEILRGRFYADMRKHIHLLLTDLTTDQPLSDIEGAIKALARGVAHAYGEELAGEAGLAQPAMGNETDASGEEPKQPSDGEQHGDVHIASDSEVRKGDKDADEGDEGPEEETDFETDRCTHDEYGETDDSYCFQALKTAARAMLNLKPVVDFDQLPTQVLTALRKDGASRAMVNCIALHTHLLMATARVLVEHMKDRQVMVNVYSLLAEKLPYGFLPETLGEKWPRMASAAVAEFCKPKAVSQRQWKELWDDWSCFARLAIIDEWGWDPMVTQETSVQSCDSIVIMRNSHMDQMWTIIEGRLIEQLGQFRLKHVNEYINTTLQAAYRRRQVADIRKKGHAETAELYHFTTFEKASKILGLQSFRSDFDEEDGYSLEKAKQGSYAGPRCSVSFCHHILYCHILTHNPNRRGRAFVAILNDVLLGVTREVNATDVPGAMSPNDPLFVTAQTKKSRIDERYDSVTGEERRHGLEKVYQYQKEHGMQSTIYEQARALPRVIFTFEHGMRIVSKWGYSLLGNDAADESGVGLRKVHEYDYEIGFDEWKMVTVGRNIVKLVCLRSMGVLVIESSRDGDDKYRPSMVKDGRITAEREQISSKREETSPVWEQGKAMEKHRMDLNALWVIVPDGATAGDGEFVDTRSPWLTDRRTDREKLFLLVHLITKQVLTLEWHDGRPVATVIPLSKCAELAGDWNREMRWGTTLDIPPEVLSASYYDLADFQLHRARRASDGSFFTPAWSYVDKKVYTQWSLQKIAQANMASIAIRSTLVHKDRDGACRPASKEQTSLLLAGAAVTRESAEDGEVFAGSEDKVPFVSLAPIRISDSSFSAEELEKAGSKHGCLKSCTVVMTPAAIIRFACDIKETGWHLQGWEVIKLPDQELAEKNRPGRHYQQIVGVQNAKAEITKRDDFYFDRWAPIIARKGWSETEFDELENQDKLLKVVMMVFNQLASNTASVDKYDRKMLLTRPYRATEFINSLRLTNKSFRRGILQATYWAQLGSSEWKMDGRNFVEIIDDEVTQDLPNQRDFLEAVQRGSRESKLFVINQAVAMYQAHSEVATRLRAGPAVRVDERVRTNAEKWTRAWMDAAIRSYMGSPGLMCADVGNRTEGMDFTHPRLSRGFLRKMGINDAEQKTAWSLAVEAVSDVGMELQDIANGKFHRTLRRATRDHFQDLSTKEEDSRGCMLGPDIDITAEAVDKDTPKGLHVLRAFVADEEKPSESGTEQILEFTARYDTTVEEVQEVMREKATVMGKKIIATHPYVYLGVAPRPRDWIKDFERLTFFTRTEP